MILQNAQSQMPRGAGVALDPRSTSLKLAIDESGSGDIHEDGGFDLRHCRLYLSSRAAAYLSITSGHYPKLSDEEWRARHTPFR